MPRRPSAAKAEMFPEDAWFNAMEAILLKIQDLQKLNKDISEKLSNLSERRAEHNSAHGNAFNKIRDVGLGLAKDELKILLRSIRSHERWSRHYVGKYTVLEREANNNSKAINMLYEQLSQTPYPGEKPLVESEDVDE